MNEYRIYLAEATPNTWYSVVEGVESVLSKGETIFFVNINGSEKYHIISDERCNEDVGIFITKNDAWDIIVEPLKL
jgi:hypothetical protein